MGKKGLKQTPEHIENIQKAVRIYWSNPENREAARKRLEIQRAAGRLVSVKRKEIRLKPKVLGGVNRSRKDYGISELCLQCNKPSTEECKAFCSWKCRDKYKDRIGYYIKTYQVPFEKAIIILQAKSLELQIRRITKPYVYVYQGTINRLPYTRRD